MSKKLFTALMISFVLTACGSDGGGGAAAKGLSSVWTSETTGASLDFTDVVLNTPNVIGFGFVGGESCGCTMAVTGAEASGNYALSACTYYGGGSGDPGCSALNSNGTFTVISSTLTICRVTAPANCSTYK